MRERGKENEGMSRLEGSVLRRLKRPKDQYAKCRG